MTARRERCLIYGGLVTIIAGIITLISPEREQAPSLSLIPIKRLNQSGTNTVIFRLTSGDGRRLTLEDLGYIQIPLSLQHHPGRWGLWRQSSLKTTCITNFVATRFTRQVDFGILEPTNAVWRLEVHLRHILPYPPWKERLENEWECLKNFNFSEMRGAWAVPNSIVYSYYAYSPDFTNGVWKP